MRILVPGNPERLRPWWTFGTWVCLHCGCNFVVDQDDPVTEEDTFHDGSYATTTCPFCARPTDASRRGGAANGYLPPLDPCLPPSFVTDWTRRMGLEDVCP